MNFEFCMKFVGRLVEQKNYVAATCGENPEPIHLGLFTWHMCGKPGLVIMRVTKEGKPVSFHSNATSEGHVKKVWNTYRHNSMEKQFV